MVHRTPLESFSTGVSLSSNPSLTLKLQMTVPFRHRAGPGLRYLREVPKGST